MTKVLCQFRTEHDQEKVLLFYLERVMEQVESGYALLAHETYNRYREQFGMMLKSSHLERLDHITNQDNTWTPDREKKILDRMNNAWAFGEHKTVHDCGYEILLHQSNQSNGQSQITERVSEMLSANNYHYIEPDSVCINTFMDASVEFIVEKRKSQSNTNKTLQGNPGFYLQDAMNSKYRCFIKQVDDADIGDRLKLKITNIPGLAFATHNTQEPIVYLEPRVSPGDIVEVELGTLSHTENSFTFRHHSYDGFLWFKRRGVNKNLFNKSTLRQGDRVVARVLYTTEEEKRSSSGQITRLGIVKAIPLRRVGDESNLEVHRSTDAAKVLS